MQLHCRLLLVAHEHVQYLSWFVVIIIIALSPSFRCVHMQKYSGSVRRSWQIWIVFWASLRKGNKRSSVRRTFGGLWKPRWHATVLPSINCTSCMAPTRARTTLRRKTGFWWGCESERWDGERKGEYEVRCEKRNASTFLSSSLPSLSVYRSACCTS